VTRKPFLPAHAGKSWGIGFDVAQQRPELVQIIGGCVTSWPFVEHHLALVLGRILGSNTDAALAMFASLRAFRAQQDAITAAAQVTLREEEQEVVQAMLGIVRTAQKMRDDLAHGHWGVCDELTDSLIWVEAKYHGPWNAQAILKGPGTGPTHEDLARHFFLYTKADLLEAQQGIRIAWRTVFDVHGYLQNKATGKPSSAFSLEALRAQPAMREALSRKKRRPGS
jgi:hypothetical protein